MSIYRAYRFFKENAGYAVGSRAVNALALARAEREAGTRGWDVSWVWDDDHDNGPRDWGWSEKECERWDTTEHECLGAVLKDEKGRVLASLWGIWDADNNYRRVVEAELASEALHEAKKEARRTATATLWEPVGL